jgi:putative two-component system response regulator
LTARIVALADTFDAITCQRRYDAARGAPAAVEVIAAERGRQFDPELTDLFLSEAVQARVHDAIRPSLPPPAPRTSKRKSGPQHASVPDVAFRWRAAGV